MGRGGEMTDDVAFLRTREQQARKALKELRSSMHSRIEQANAEGKLLPMLGTVNGEDGWYQAADYVYHFKVEPDGSWQQQERPITLREYRSRAVQGLEGFVHARWGAPPAASVSATAAGGRRT